MKAVQVLFQGLLEESVQGGILIEDGDDFHVICGCCGGVYDSDEVEIIERFDDKWVDFSQYIS